jgi:uncharacterized FlaG/YvyC family protein
MRTPSTELITPVAAGDTVRMPAIGAVKSSPPVTPVLGAKAAAAAVPVPDMRETLQRVATRLEEYLRSSGRNLELRVDDATGTTVISVRDASTGELIRQIPSEEALRLQERFEQTVGVLIDQIG